MIIAKSFQLDFRTKYNEIIKVNQYEQDGRVFEIQCMSDIVPINLTGATVTFYAKKPDDSIVYNDCVITDAISGKVTYTMTEQTCAADGLLSCWIEIIWSSAVIRSFSFTIEVVTALDETGAIESTSEFTALETALATAAGLDAAAVHKAGAETITGVKTYTVSPIVPNPTAAGEASNKGYVDAKTARCNIVATRAISNTAGTGSQVINFPAGRFTYAPTAIRIRCVLSGYPQFFSEGTMGPDNQSCIYRIATGPNIGEMYAFTNSMAVITNAISNAFYVNVSAVTATSMTLNWERVNEGITGTVTIQIEAEG